MPADWTGQNSTLINACRLWEQTSQKGNRYLVGRMGGLKVLILENTRPAEGDTSTHTLFFGEAAKRPQDAPQRVDGATLEADGRERPAPAPSTRQQPGKGKVPMPVSDQVPF
jgi:hypothetical protein